MLNKEESKVLVRMYRSYRAGRPYLVQNEKEIRILKVLIKGQLATATSIRSGMTVAYLTPQGKRLAKMIGETNES